jgi:N-methylhydantoinase A
VFDRAALRAGHRISGPAVIEEAASVTLLRPGQTLTVDDYGNLRIGGQDAK